MKTINIDRALTRAQAQLNEVEQAIAIIRAEIDRLDALPEFQLLKEGMLVKGLSFAIKELGKRRRVISDRVDRLTCEKEHEIHPEGQN
jgi:hypothetical protein